MFVLIRLRCFGHIHAKMHFTDIDNSRSGTLETLASLEAGKWDTPEMVTDKKARLEGYREKGYCAASCTRDDAGNQTLFINAAIQSRLEETKSQLPWLVEMELPRAPAAAGDGLEGEVSGQSEKGEKKTAPVENAQPPSTTMTRNLKRGVSSKDDWHTEMARPAKRRMQFCI